jgi:hypothetical protein
MSLRTVRTLRTLTTSARSVESAVIRESTEFDLYARSSEIRRQASDCVAEPSGFSANSVASESIPQLGI